MTRAKGLDMSSPENPDVRLALVESEIRATKAEITDIKGSVASVVLMLGTIRDDLSTHPRSVPYREMIGAVASTLAALAVVSGYAQWWIAGAVSPISQNVARIERTIDPGDYAVIKYRLDQLEKQNGKLVNYKSL